MGEYRHICPCCQSTMDPYWDGKKIDYGCHECGYCHNFDPENWSRSNKELK